MSKSIFKRLIKKPKVKKTPEELPQKIVHPSAPKQSGKGSFPSGVEGKLKHMGSGVYQLDITPELRKLKNLIQTPAQQKAKNKTIKEKAAELAAARKTMGDSKEKMTLQEALKQNRQAKHDSAKANYEAAKYAKVKEILESKKKTATAAKTKKQKNVDAAGKQFMPKKPIKGKNQGVAGMGTNKRKPKTASKKLLQEWEGLKPNAKNAEKLKGKRSKFLPVFKQLNMGRIVSPKKPAKKYKNKILAGAAVAGGAAGSTVLPGAENFKNMKEVERGKSKKLLEEKKKGGGKVVYRKKSGGVGKGSKPISTTGTYGGKQKIANWMEGLTPAEIGAILGNPTLQPDGSLHHRKPKKTPKQKRTKTKVAKKPTKPTKPISTTGTYGGKTKKAKAGGKIKGYKHGGFLGTQPDGGKIVSGGYD